MTHVHNEIILYGFGEALGTADISPFVTKAEILLSMAGLPYRIESCTRPDQGPKKKIPFVEDNGRLVGDSTLIRFYLERIYGTDFDKNVSEERKAVAWLAEKYLEQDLYFSVLRNRWLHEGNFNTRIRPFFDKVPAFLRPFILKKMKSQTRKVLFNQGTGRHTDEELVALAARSAKSMDALLGDARYFGGDVMCGSDASIAPFIAGAVTPYFDSPYIEVFNAYPRLTSYSKRVLEHFGLPYPSEKI